jgi:hypothetical protein
MPTQPKASAENRSVPGEWFRAKSYRVQNGLIVARGPVEKWDPLRLHVELWDAKSGTSPGAELANIAQRVGVTEPTGAVEADSISLESEALIEEWCSRYGPLGVGRHFARLTALATDPAALTPSVRGALQRASATASPNRLVLGSLERFEVAGREASRPTATDQSGAESVFAFVAAARLFADAFLGGSVTDLRAEKAEALLAVVSPTAVPGPGLLSLRWDSPSLLGLLSILQLLDDGNGCALGVCQWHKCGQVFARRLPSRQYCSDRHQKTAEVHRARQRKG